MASSEEQQQPQEPPPPSPPSSSTPPTATTTEDESVLHKTKTIQFFNRSTPIVLQNDNGPCPLLAICNVLLLKNQLNLNPDISEVSQQKLLSLVAERLIDANSNVNDKEAGYVENQQQNISDAIDLLPRLATGIDVNIKFRRIDDFEYTRECAVFDLLDIPLYHGWLVDPQDHETAEAIGSKSYNTLMGDLVSLETRNMENNGKDKVDEDCIDFAAATTATLGVPSPSLSKAKSFDESPRSSSDQPVPRKGDAEEEAELLRVLKLSENTSPGNGDDLCVTSSPGGEMLTMSVENVNMMKSTPENPVNMSESYNSTGLLDEPSTPGSDAVPDNCDKKVLSCEETTNTVDVRDSGERHINQLFAEQSVEGSLSIDVIRSDVDASIETEPTPSLSVVKDTLHGREAESLSLPVPDVVAGLHKQNEELLTSTAGHADSESSSGRIPSIEAVGSFTSSLDDSEPIYEGEECILDSGKTVCEDREPVYEGEVVLAEQVDKGTSEVNDAGSKDEITIRQGELINNFLKSNASQLTFYGLFSLQEGLKERELCVFFRNNHFSTMFKFEGELYLLATDQGYLNQPDLVWEKLNEVNGDTLFMTSNFKEFKLESSGNGTWDEQNAVASTADYLASIDSSAQAGSNMNSDLQLAIALQQQEFEQQPQRNASQQPSSTGTSRLITGPQVPRTSARPTSSSQRQDQKSKDKSNCKIM